MLVSSSVCVINQLDSRVSQKTAPLTTISIDYPLIDRLTGMHSGKVFEWAQRQVTHARMTDDRWCLSFRLTLR